MSAGDGHVLHKLLIIALMCCVSSILFNFSDLSLKRLVSRPVLHSSASGIFNIGKHDFILYEANSWGFFSPVLLVNSRRFRQEVDLGSSETIFATARTSLLGDPSKLQKNPAY